MARQPLWVKFYSLPEQRKGEKSFKIRNTRVKEVNEGKANYSAKIVY